MSNILSRIDKKCLEELYPSLVRIQQNMCGCDIEIICGYPCIYMGQGGGTGSLGGMLCREVHRKDELIRGNGEEAYQEGVKRLQRRLKEEDIETKIMKPNYILFRYKDVEFIIEADRYRKAWMVYKKGDVDYTEFQNWLNSLKEYEDEF